VGSPSQPSAGFSYVVAGLSSLGGTWADRVVYGGVSIWSFKLGALLIIAAMVVLALGPLASFSHCGGAFGPAAVRQAAPTTRRYCAGSRGAAGRAARHLGHPSLAVFANAATSGRHPLAPPALVPRAAAMRRVR
jgi:hypothetical protein